jgi:hypothetical protein
VRRGEGLSGSTAYHGELEIHNAALLLSRGVHSRLPLALCICKRLCGGEKQKFRPPTTVPPSHHRQYSHRAHIRIPITVFFLVLFLGLRDRTGSGFFVPGRPEICVVLGSLLVQNRQRPSIPADHPSSKCKKFLFFLSLHDFGEGLRGVANRSCTRTSVVCGTGCRGRVSNTHSTRYPLISRGTPPKILDIREPLYQWRCKP